MKFSKKILCTAAALSVILNSATVFGANSCVNTYRGQSSRKYCITYVQNYKNSKTRIPVRCKNGVWRSFQIVTDENYGKSNQNTSANKNDEVVNNTNNNQNSCQNNNCQQKPGGTGNSCTGGSCQTNQTEKPASDTNADNCTGGNCQNNQTQKPDNSGTNSQTKPDSDKVDISSDAYKVLDLVNQYRKAQGLSALTMNENAVKAANVRAEEISRSFAHTRPNGSSFSTALDAVGITKGYRGENIANGYKTPDDVMTAWMNSPGHKANILNANYKEIGVGIYKDGSGRLNWVQLFVG